MISAYQISSISDRILHQSEAAWFIFMTENGEHSNLWVIVKCVLGEKNILFLSTLLYFFIFCISCSEM